MDLTKALLDALREIAGSDVRSIELASPGSILLTHTSGAQLMVNARAFPPAIMEQPERLMAEAGGALASLARIADTARQPREQDARTLIVPVLRTADWITAAGRESGGDLVQARLAFPFGRSLFITFALEHADRRVPVLDWRSIADVDPPALFDLARENQLRMVRDSVQDLTATDLHTGDGTFFLRSTNLQAASLILQPFSWHLITHFAPNPPRATIGTIVGPDAVLFGPAETSALEFYADMLRATLRGLRKSFGGEGDWGEDIFTYADKEGLPTCLG